MTRPVERMASWRVFSVTSLDSAMPEAGSCSHCRIFAMLQTECLLCKDLRLAPRDWIWLELRERFECEVCCVSSSASATAAPETRPLPPCEGTKALKYEDLFIAPAARLDSLGDANRDQTDAAAAESALCTTRFVQGSSSSLADR